MAIYSLSQRTASGTAATAAWEIRSTSTNKTRVYELGLTQNAATAGVYGIGRPAAIGVTPTSPQTFLDESDGNGPTGLATAAVAWATGPTVPANFFRRYSCAATIGVGFITAFPKGMTVAVSNSIVIWVIATAPVCDCYAAAEE
jgi:hypothetical protein